MIHIYRIRKGVPGVGRKIARAFDAQEVTSKNPHNKIKTDDFVINYGRSVMPDWYNESIRIFNHPESVAFAVNKVETFKVLSKIGLPTLKFFTDKEEAENHLRKAGHIIVRHLVSGKQGKGIELLTEDDEVPEAPLYTEFFPKTHEFRVHVAFGKVIDFVQKKKMGSDKLKRLGLDEPNMLLRNHKRGWIFGRKNTTEGELIKQVAVDAVEVLGLDYGGVDVMVKFNSKKTDTRNSNIVDLKVAEVNSAPGMRSPTTFNAYINSFKEEMNYV